MNGPHELIFFADRDLGRQFPDKLREVSQRRWVAVTRDARIRYSPLALSVLMESGERLFVIVGKLTTLEAADVFLKWRGRIESIALEEDGAFIAKIRRDGVHLWLSRRNWQRALTFPPNAR
jgi:hypothetical protein